MSRRLGVWDWVIAFAVTIALVVAGLLGGHQPTSLDWLGYGLLAIAGMSLAARRWVPVGVLVVTGICVLGSLVIGFPAPSLAYLVAVYAAMRAGHRIVTAAASVLMLTAVPLAILASASVSTLGVAVAQSRDALPLAWLIAAGAAGEALRQAERRAEEAERTREETARRRADEERLHIARELHDSLTHQISVIKVQSEVAVHLARKRGEPLPEALVAIREAGRAAAADLRATLEALRDDDKHPPPGLEDVQELVERARTAGLAATLSIDGQRHAVPATVNRTGYRIVQESLTNIARHAAAPSASIRIAYRADSVIIQVDDDGVAEPDVPVTPGVGLLGMRERVTALGGQLRAAPRCEGGFTVRAELPVSHTS